MTKAQRKRYTKRKNQILKRNILRIVLFQAMIILTIMFFKLSYVVSQFEKDMAKTNNAEYSIGYNEVANEVQSTELIKPDYESIVAESEANENLIEYSKDWSTEENYMLAKIAMAEAEGCSNETKQCVIQVILNRVHDDYFPDTIYDVLFQHSGDVYQFTPVINGRWDRVEPNEDCFNAVNAVAMNTHDISMGALYFESCKNKDNWHSRNLEFLFELDGLRFYK